MSAQAAEERIFVSKLRKTEMIESGHLRQTFDMLDLPGMQIVCVSALDHDTGDLAPISQVYQLPDGHSFEDL